MERDHHPVQPTPRRSFLSGLASAASVLLSARVARAAGPNGQARALHGKSSEEAEVTPGEDLMQEHGVLERILLIYEEAARRIEHGEALDSAVLTNAANLVRRFVEDYHERLEEQQVFPRLESARREVSLVTTLRLQHERGRALTDGITRLAPAGASPQLGEALRAFIRMYRPHAAREETVLFPAFRELMGRDAYRELGEQFEAEEHARVGEHGFEEAVLEVARLEMRLGIHDLSAFTPL